MGSIEKSKETRSDFVFILATRKLKIFWRWNYFSVCHPEDESSTEHEFIKSETKSSSSDTKRNSHWIGILQNIVSEFMKHSEFLLNSLAKVSIDASFLSWAIFHIHDGFMEPWITSRVSQGKDWNRIVFQYQISSEKIRSEKPQSLLINPTLVVFISKWVATFGCLST